MIPRDGDDGDGCIFSVFIVTIVTSSPEMKRKEVSDHERGANKIQPL